MSSGLPQAISSQASPPTRTGRAFSNATLFLFTVICAYVVFPLIEVPLLGLSLSAPFFFIVALEVFFKPPEAWLHRYRIWLGLAMWIWTGIFLAAASNGLLSGGMDFDSQGFVSLMRYAYWLLVFVVTTYIVSRAQLGPRLLTIMSLAILGVAVLRWVEALLYGDIGAWSGTVFFTQNSYGWLFSTFSPFLLALFLGGETRQRWLWGLANLVVWGAAAINGSRGSWVAMSIGALVFILLYAVSNPRYLTRLFFLVLFIALFTAGLLFAPQRVVGAVSQRFATLQRLDEDKSYAIRQLMIQKGLRLFEQSPIMGVGVSRWTQESAPLNIPVLLGYAPQSYFDVKSPHNSYISFLAENGLLGAVPFALLLLILAVKGALASIHLARQKALWALAFYAGFVATSIHLWALAGLTNTGTWLVYGLVAAGIQVADQPVQVSDRRR